MAVGRDSLVLWLGELGVGRGELVVLREVLDVPGEQAVGVGRSGLGAG